MASTQSVRTVYWATRAPTLGRLLVVLSREEVLAFDESVGCHVEVSAINDLPTPGIYFNQCCRVLERIYKRITKV